jgi:polar amino acid transport system substrate-binding protein
MLQFHCLRRVLKVALLVIAASSSLSFGQTSTANLSHGPSIDAIRAKGILTIGVTDDPPWSMQSAVSMGPGIIPDMVLAFAKREGIAKVDIQPMPFASFIGALTSARIDIAADTLTPNAERAKIIDFPEPVVFNPGGLLVPPGNPRHLHQVADFNNGIKISVAEGTLYSKALQGFIANGQKIEVLTVPGFNEQVGAVVSGQVDAAIADAVVTQYALKVNPNLGLDIVTDFDPTGDKTWTTVMPSTVADMAFAKANADLREAWNRDFTEMSKDGTIDKIFVKYGLTPSIYVANPADPEYRKH